MRMLLKTLGDKQTKQGRHKPTRWEHKHAIKKYTGSINSLFLYESGFSIQSGSSSLSSAEQQAHFLDLTANVWFIILCFGMGEAAGVKRKMLKWKNETLNQTLFNSHLGLMTSLRKQASLSMEYVVLRLSSTHLSIIDAE